MDAPYVEENLGSGNNDEGVDRDGDEGERLIRIQPVSLVPGLKNLPPNQNNLDNPYADDNHFADNPNSVRRNRDNPAFIGSKLLTARSGGLSEKEIHQDNYSRMQGSGGSRANTRSLNKS